MLDNVSGDLEPQKSFLALSWESGAAVPATLHAALSVLGNPGGMSGWAEDGMQVRVHAAGAADIVDPDRGRLAVLMTDGARLSTRDVEPAEASRWAASATRDPMLDRVQPPFAVVHRAAYGDPLRVATDSLGFRHVYATRGRGWAALSSSARSLAVLSSAAIDAEALAAQSLLGWQIGLRTLFAGVEKLSPGVVASLQDGRLSRSVGPRPVCETPADLSTSTRQAAQLLQEQVAACLDQHPDLLLQLTGGQDSRLLLSAIPPARRRDVVALTLAVPGSPDLEIATRLTSMFDMKHEVVHLAGLEEQTPDAAHGLAMAAARRLDGMADPLAFASLALAEAAISSRPRLSGLGGEFVRGFYQVGPLVGGRVSAKRVRRLARWRLFPNESTPGVAFSEEFRQWRVAVTLNRLQQVFSSYDVDWATATDSFYLEQRMQRWAGLLASATCLDRLVMNPMLDPQFLDLGRSLPPRWKAASRFLGSIQCELDLELARLPLDGRPAPIVYASAGPVANVKLGALMARKVWSKTSQRVTGGGRPPAGGVGLAGLVVQYWRNNPGHLEGVRRLQILDDCWVERVLEGRIETTPSAVALLINLEAVSEAMHASAD